MLQAASFGWSVGFRESSWASPLRSYQHGCAVRNAVGQSLRQAVAIGGCAGQADRAERIIIRHGLAATCVYRVQHRYPSCSRRKHLRVGRWAIRRVAQIAPEPSRPIAAKGPTQRHAPTPMLRPLLVC
jgi:hypothetical protein